MPGVSEELLANAPKDFPLHKLADLELKASKNGGQITYGEINDILPANVTSDDALDLSMTTWPRAATRSFLMMGKEKKICWRQKKKKGTKTANWRKRGN